MRNLTLSFLFAVTTAFAGTYTSETVVLQDMFSPWSLPFGTTEFHGSVSTRSTLTQSQSTSSWLDWLGAPWILNPWYNTSSYNRLEDTKTTQVGIREISDSNGNAGTDNSQYHSQTASTVRTLGSTFFPLEDRVHIDTQRYGMLDLVDSTSAYGWNCWDLINVGLSGGCAGSNKWSRTTTSMGLGGMWLDFDIMSDGSIANFQSGNITTWFYSFTESGYDSWESQPSVPSFVLNEPTSSFSVLDSSSNASATPEPTTWGLIVIGSIMTAVLRMRRPKWLPVR
jgi:hypothetical protein